MDILLLKVFDEYKSQVIKQLRNKINIQKGETIIENYVFKHSRELWLFDLVVLNEEILRKIYIVKYPSSIESNFNFIKELLKKYKQITKAQVFLVCSKSGELSINEVEELEGGTESKSNSPQYIKSFSDFYSELKKIIVDNEAFDKQYFFRGHSDVKYEPVPSIYRSKNIEYEDRLYHEAIRRNSSEFTGEMSTFDSLVKMQHYELPTRLLDITANPLIALFFACKENDNVDGKVLIFPVMNEQKKYYDSDAVCILSNLAKQSKDFAFTEHKERLVYDIQKDIPQFKGEYLKLEAIKEVFCVMPKLNNERIICQQGAFFIFGMDSSKSEPAKLLDKPIEIVIKAESKSEIMKDLNLLGINEAVLFPETDKIMKQIKTELNN